MEIHRKEMIESGNQACEYLRNLTVLSGDLFRTRKNVDSRKKNPTRSKYF